MLKDLYAQPVACGPDIGGQIKVRGSEGIFAVTYKLAVEPDIEGFFHTLEADADPFSGQSGIQIKITDIAGNGVVVPIHLGRQDLGMTVPGIKLVDILDLAVALELQMTGDLNGIKSGIVIALHPVVFGAVCRCCAPVQQPLAIENLLQGAAAGVGFFRADIGDVIRVRIQAVYLKYGRVFQPLQIGNHSKISFLFWWETRTLLIDMDIFIIICAASESQG